MKRYYEVAHFAAEDAKITGFVLADTYNKNICFVDMDEFTQLVRKNEVQFFIYTSLGLQIAFTEEEKSELGKFYDSQYQDLATYFRDDMKISSEYFDLAKAGEIIGVCAAPFALPLIGTNIPIYLLGTSERLQKLLQDEVIKKLTHYSKFGIPYYNLNEHVDYVPDGIIYDTTTLKKLVGTEFVHKLKKSHKIFNPLVKEPDDRYIYETMIRLNGSTTAFMRQLNGFSSSMTIF